MHTFCANSWIYWGKHRGKWIVDIKSLSWQQAVFSGDRIFHPLHFFRERTLTLTSISLQHKVRNIRKPWFFAHTWNRDFQERRKTISKFWCTIKIKHRLPLIKPHFSMQYQLLATLVSYRKLNPCIFHFCRIPTSIVTHKFIIRT